MIKCVAIDDEPIALSIIAEHCRRLGLELECYTSPVAGMERIAASRPDIVFLDIEMNSHNGLALARQLPEGTCLIFTTAYPEYALEGFDADAVDFLHKPIFFPRFERAIEKARKWLGASPEAGVRRPEAITLKSEHKNLVVNIADITYIEAMDNYVKVYRRSMPMVLSQITMKEMEAMLPSDRFIRVHRSFIVALEAIAMFSNRKIYLQGVEKPVPVGRKYVEAFNSLYDIFRARTQNQ